MQEPTRDIVRTTLGVLFIGLLIVSCLWILRPFIGATIWATMLVVATWPVLLWFERRLWGRRSLAVGVMSLLMLLLFFVPLMLAIGTIVSHSDVIVSKVKSFAGDPLPQPPAWVSGLPFVGEKVAVLWQDVIASGASGLLARLTPYADDIFKWSVSQAGGVGFLFVQFLLTVAISALMYASGETAAAALLRFGRRLAGVHGGNAVTLAGQAIRSVALGVGVTAIVQAGLGGVGLAIAGIPFAGLLTAVMLLLCIAQVGPSLVLFPAVAWVYWTGENGWGTFLLVWSVVVATMDNVLRPALIKRGADLPLILIFAGVIGGLLAFGLVGIFVGPVMLAVAYTLLGSWVGDGVTPNAATPTGPAPDRGAG
jgi:predicted PurR-regulated permease PerM